MIVAQEKRKNNIAEYVLYMWQIEDTLRAFKFDMQQIEDRLISQFKQPESVLGEIRNWYTNLILSMHEEGIKEKGHLQIVHGTIEELNQLHKRLIYEIKNPKYIELYEFAKPNILEFSKKLNTPEYNELEVCLYGLYGLLLLRLKKKEVSKETLKAMGTFSTLLSQLSFYYKQVEEGKSEF